MKIKVLGRWSVASLLKLAVDVPYYGLMVVLPVICAVGIWVSLAPAQRGKVDISLPVRFALDPARHAFSTAQPGGLKSASVGHAEGDLVVKGVGPTAVRAAFGLAVIALGTALFVLSQLRAVFRTLRDQDPFVAKNPGRIRMIGLALIAGHLLVVLLGAWAAARLTRDVSLEGIVFEGGPSLNSWVLFSGVVLVLLAEVFRLGAKMKGDLETARRIQFDLIPGESFRKDDLVVQARMQPARTVGGDYYDMRDLGDGRVALFLGDVAGKGLPAALLMTSVLGSVRALLAAGLRGKALVAALNRHVCENSGGRMVTLFYAELEVATGTLTYVNAGHNPPLLARGQGQVEPLQPTAMLLGAMADGVVEDGTTCVGPADRLLVFTDGLSEAFNPKEEEYGEERIRESLSAARELGPKAAVDRLVSDVLAFCGKAPQHDDMTLMLVARRAT